MPHGNIATIGADMYRYANQSLGIINFFNLYPLSYLFLIFHPLEVVSRYRDPQFQVGENYSCLFNLRPNICLNYHLFSNN